MSTLKSTCVIFTVLCGHFNCPNKYHDVQDQGIKGTISCHFLYSELSICKRRFKMKYIFAFLVLLPFIFGAPSERFLLDTFGLDKVVNQIEQFAHSGMAHDTCVAECQKAVHGFAANFCDTGCTTVINLVPSGQ